MPATYGLVEKFEGFVDSPGFFKALLAEFGAKRILEVGSGANPTLSPEDVRKHDLVYVTSDINPEELAKADSAFEPLVLDMLVESIDPALMEGFDFIGSRMVGEHIRDGRKYHSNIYKMLRPGGISVQCCSTLWAFPFAANRLMPESISDFVLDKISPRDRHRHGKFPAYYSWSRDPTRKMIQNFRSIGFEIVRYTGYFGHCYYLSLPFLHRLETWKSRQLLRHPIPQLCSYTTIILRKPN